MTPDPAVVIDRLAVPVRPDRPGPSWIGLRVHAASVAIGRRFARDVVCGHVTADHAYTIVLLVSELLTNALRRAAEVQVWDHRDRPVKLGVLATDRWVELSITDPDPAPIDPGGRVENGYGLGIVDALAAARWPVYSDDSKTVHVVVPAPDVELTAAELEQIGAPA